MGKGSTCSSSAGLMASRASSRALRLYVTSVSSGSGISNPTACPRARISSLVRSTISASFPRSTAWTPIWHSDLDSIPHQLQEPLLNDRGLEGHLQIPCLVGTARGVLVELLDQVGDESLHLWRGKLLSHPACLRG